RIAARIASAPRRYSFTSPPRALRACPPIWNRDRHAPPSRAGRGATPHDGAPAHESPRSGDAQSFRASSVGTLSRSPVSCCSRVSDCRGRGNRAPQDGAGFGIARVERVPIEPERAAVHEERMIPQNRLPYCESLKLVHLWPPVSRFPCLAAWGQTEVSRAARTWASCQRVSVHGFMMEQPNGP